MSPWGAEYETLPFQLPTEDWNSYNPMDYAEPIPNWDPSQGHQFDLLGGAPSWAGQAKSIGAERNLGDTPMTPPLLVQAFNKIFGREQQPWTLNDYVMGLTTGPMRGPKIQIPDELSSLMSGGAKTMAEWTGLQRPWSGIYKGALGEGRTTPSPSWQNPMEFNLPSVDLPGLLRKMGPATNLYAPEFLRNADFFKRLGWF